MEQNKKLPSGAAKLFAALLAICMWQLAAVLVHNRLLLVGPLEAARTLLKLMCSRGFYYTAGHTFARISLGFVLGFCMAAVLAALAGRFPLAELLLQPYMTAIQTVPVASFIVIALLWLSGRRLSTFISFLMVLPVMYTAFLRGIHSADRQLLEMAKVFRMSALGRVRGIYAPATEPFVLSGCHVALGLCWKSGVAAEVIAVTGGTIGGRLYDAKVYLEISDLFAWTFVIVAISVCFEKLVVYLLRQLYRRLEA